MANRLTMAQDSSDSGSTHKQSWRNRKIARELGVERETVAKYVRAAGCDAKPAKAPIGSEGSKPAKAPLGLEGISGASDPGQPAPRLVAGGTDSATADPSESEVGRSACEPYRQVILEKLELGLSAQRIY